MIKTGFETRVKVQQVIENQLPEFLRSESPKAVDFLKQYYISQEYQGGPMDLANNLDQYLKFDNLSPEVISGETTLSAGISSTTDTVQVASTKGFPAEYGLFKIDNEIFTYTGITTNSFTGCVRGFSGITSYRTQLNAEELVFSTSERAAHTSGTTVKNLSVEFLKEFYKKLKYSFTPGLENVDFVSDLDVNNFIKEARTLYQSKGTEESYRILFNIIFGVTPKVVDLEGYLLKPSTSEYLRREVVVAERISGDPNKLLGQTIKKSTDEETQASVSEVEIFTRSGITTYYKLNLFVGYDDKDLIEGTFDIQPKSKVINPVSVGSSVITVDTTIGFTESGTLISGDNTITYTSKTVNQFLGCSGVETAISTTDEIRTSEVFVGYEDGDISKKVEIRITGVISDFEQRSDILLSTEGQQIYVKNVGEKVLNPDSNSSYKQIFANSWIYNTSSRYQVEQISGSAFKLKSSVDKSSLKVGDKVDILQGNTETVAHSNAEVASVSGSTVTLNNLSGFTHNTSLDYTIRRKLNTASSSGTPLLYGNDVLTTDVQNVYFENDEYYYVASNSLPSYEVTKTVKKATISSASGSALQGYSSSTEKYNTLSFPSSVPFITGDKVKYSASGTALSGMPEGVYYVKVLSPNNKIKLYLSRALIQIDTPVEFTSTSSSGSHTFVLVDQEDEKIYPQKIFKKFPSSKNIKIGNKTETIPGSTGLFVNGVEILNYKSEDKIYYGPVSKLQVYNGGTDYDVVNPPTVSIASPSSGTTALARAVVSGSVHDVLVDPQSFDVKDVLSATIEGGNGSGAVLKPIVETRYREIDFNGSSSLIGGGVDYINDVIVFSSSHNLTDGDGVVYNRNGNTAIGIGTFGGSNNPTGNTLISGSVYYAGVENATSIKLYSSKGDHASGINTVGFTTAVSQGTHKLKTFAARKTLTSIKVLDGGSGYTNKKLYVKTSGISSVEDTITFENHGFSDGDIITYSTTGTAITGLSTTSRYYVLKEDNNRFRVANAGIGGTITTNYTKRDYVDLQSSGTGYQIFSYPDITVTVNAEFSSSADSITATPIIRGSIDDVYLYENGTGYGTEILNFHKKPQVSLNIGKDAELTPVISSGRITSVIVSAAGQDYTSAPLLTLNSRNGVGAKLRAVVNDAGKITSVVVLNGGIGYGSDTTITVSPNGRNAYIEASVRDLTVNKLSKFDKEIIIKNPDNNQGLEYGFVGYSTSIGDDVYGDDGSDHSPIIGWAFDGNPIYGPYAYSDSDDINSSIKPLTSGYTLSTSSVVDRPSSFASGFFVEDYIYDNSGDLDEYNGRYEKTPEFPKGVYAYHATISNTSSEPEFPYFVGNYYKSLPLDQSLDQTFDFNSSNLLRNTFPYKVAEKYADNDFISEANEALIQNAIIESITKGSVTGLTINEDGDEYMVGDVASFDNTDTNGGGISADVKSVVGKRIVSIDTSVDSYQSTKVVWENSNKISLHLDNKQHQILDGESVVVSGLSTFISGLTKSHLVGITSETTTLIRQLPSNTTAGVVTDIYVSRIPVSLSVGSTVAIGTEGLSVLNIFPSNKVVRATRSVTGTAHTASTEVTVVDGKLTIDAKVDYFESKLNDKVYFHPTQSVGIGTTAGIAVSNSYTIADLTSTISVPTQSIYLPNHPFKNAQPVTFSRVAGSNAISVASTETSTPFNIPTTGNTQTLYVINKSKDYIGLTTSVGLTTNTGGLFFISFTENGDASDYQYALESNFNQVTATVSKVDTVVSVSTSHLLSNGDNIILDVKPGQSVGIATTTPVVVKYNSNHNKLLVNPVGFTSVGVNTVSDQLTITSHGFKTGDKVFYDSSDILISGLTTGSYYVYRIDDNNLNLTDTYYDAVSSPPSIVSLGSTGGAGQELTSINPRIEVERNNSLVFDVSHSSLNGYNFNIYRDAAFNNKLVSTGSTTVFSVTGVGTIGVSSTARVTLDYSDELPTIIYYSLEKSGYITTADNSVKNSSEILFVDSPYKGNYNVFGVGTTTFHVSLNEVPDFLSYTQDNTDVLEYSTTSATAKGGVKSMRIVSGGNNYKRLPKFNSIISTSGEGADIIPTSSTIGRIKEVSVDDAGFDFSADKTLNPEAYISPTINVINRDIVTNVSILDGGRNYVSAPDLVIVNPETGSAYSTGVLEAEIQGSAIFSVNIIESPIGLAQINNKLYAVNNSNGIGISSCFSSNTGIITCHIATPILGFSTAPFTVGEEVFVENIRKFGTSGEGHNSTDHGYNFFTVSSFTNSNPAIVEFDISEYTTNPGIAVTNQSLYASIIKKSDYPSFELTQVLSNFILDEPILTLEGNDYVERDLIVTENLEDSIKVYGTYVLSEDDVILGKYSGTKATINSIVENRAIFKVDYSTRKNLGWSDDIGKLNQDYQVTSDNDYFQNLSYTIKSPIEYEDLINPVNRLLHTSGLKNFADTEIQTTVNAGSATTSTSSSTLALVDIISEERVDTINDFDLVIDIDTQTYSPARSKYIKFQNKKLADYIKCVSNRVLFVDNINSQFSNEGDADLYVDMLNYSINDGLNRFVVQVINPDSTERQISEIYTLPTVDKNIITFERGSLFNTSDKVADISGHISEFGALTLRFLPTEQFDSDYDIKILRNNFSSSLAGIGTRTVGFVNLTGSNISVGAGNTSSIINANTSSTESLFVSAEVEDLTTNELNYVELFVDHNGTDTFVSEYYLDNDSPVESSTNFIGTFTSSINSGVLSINFENTESNTVFVRSKVVGFGTTAAGIGTYRFLSSGQPEGSETTVRLHSDFVNQSGISTIFSVARSDVTSIKSLVRVSYGSTSALHQILVVHDGTDTYTLQYPFLSIQDEVGIGTFGSKFDGSDLVVNFYPESGISDTISLQAFSEFIQSESDLDNTPLDLSYGSVRESLLVSGYDSINGNRVNKTEFELKHNDVPIFQKTFNPSDTDVLNLQTGTFTVADHFFSTGEQLTYNSASSFDGATVNPIIDSNTTVGLATTVFAIRVNSSQFRLASSKANATAGTAITFTSAGDGNAHTLEMSKKMEKSLITVNGVVQSPISYALITKTLQHNSGSVGVNTEYMALSGISTILPGDILKIEDEFIKVSAVGFGSTSTGPITGIGTFNLVKGVRGFVGSSATSHNNGVDADVYVGAFNIVGSNIHFTEPPRGNSGENVDSSNLPYPKASFGGRVYLRNDYTTNKIYDNISKNFTGVGATYTVSVGGANTTGIETGSGLVFINDVFQTPSTVNNLGNNYSFSENAGISSVVFTGITDSLGNLVLSDYDVNANQLPRGGIIVSLGSTPGLGYAPLVGAAVTAVVGAGGSIVSVGLGTTDILGSGYNSIVSIGISVFEEGHIGDVASISATVGAGGTLAFTVGAGGTGYTNPQIHVSEPSYENLEVVGVSRLGMGATTDTGVGLLLSVEVGAASTNVGIGSTLFEVTSFKITRPGYGFKKGDVFRPVGLVTGANLSSPVNDFELTVLDTFTDSFSAWQFGELDFIDSVSEFQNGSRTRFPLYYNNELISFEVDTNDAQSAEIDLNSILLVFVNGVIQEPGIHYRFEGGTSIVFDEAPDASDNISIFFYRGTRGTDSFSVDIISTLEVGDILQVNKNNIIDDTITQDFRTVYSIQSSDRVETNLYRGVGIDETNYKPVNWTKKKVDSKISGEFVYKTRDSIETQVYPTAKIISGITTTDTEIFVDDANFFNYEENESAIVISDVDALIVSYSNPVAAAITATVSAAGTISGLSINNGGSGYTGASVSVSIAAPKSIGVGVGTTATATVTVSGGQLTTPVTITNPGFGYTATNPPQVLAPTSNVTYENITDITTVNGFSGIVTGISTSSGIGTDLAIKFFLSADTFTGLTTGYPILISNTHVGNGVTSIDTVDSNIVGIGTSFVDNIYTIHDLNLPLGSGGSIADITVNVLSTTDTTGISTSGVNVGTFSWGRLSGFTRSSSPISIGVTGLTIDSGLSTYPTIQRRGYGLRTNGSLRKDLG